MQDPSLSRHHRIILGKLCVTRTSAFVRGLASAEPGLDKMKRNTTPLVALTQLNFYQLHFLQDLIAQKDSPKTFAYILIKLALNKKSWARFRTSCIPHLLFHLFSVADTPLGP
ncbi:MAG: hypothetical protein EBT07_09165 [Actinobacteria bacterium]|nr:hypothetical protein [Actinomycetota bacterium]